MDDGMDFPVVVHRVDLEPFEKLSSPLEDILESRDHQRFAEPPWTRDEEQIAARIDNQPMEIVRLVDVNTVSFRTCAKVCKISGTLGNRLHAAHYTTFVIFEPLQTPKGKTRQFMMRSTLWGCEKASEEILSSVCLVHFVKTNGTVSSSPIQRSRPSPSLSSTLTETLTPPDVSKSSVMPKDASGSAIL